jgi:hypothetical protein
VFYKFNSPVFHQYGDFRNTVALNAVQNYGSERLIGAKVCRNSVHLYLSL